MVKYSKPLDLTDSLTTTKKSSFLLNNFGAEMTHCSPPLTAIKYKVCLPCQYTVAVDTPGMALCLLCGFQQETYLIPGFFLSLLLNPCV